MLIYCFWQLFLELESPHDQKQQQNNKNAIHDIRQSSRRDGILARKPKGTRTGGQPGDQYPGKEQHIFVIPGSDGSGTAHQREHHAGHKKSPDRSPLNDIPPHLGRKQGRGFLLLKNRFAWCF